MKFHDINTCYSRRERLGRWTKNKTLQEFTRYMAENNRADVTQLAVEGKWHEGGRPYYKVYPAIAKMLTAVKLDTDSGNLRLPGGILAIQFAERHEPEGIRYILAYEHHQEDGKYLAILSYYRHPDTPLGMVLLQVITFPILPGESVESLVSRACEKSDYAIDAHTTIPVRIVLALSLLADDPELIVGDVLSKDKLEYDSATAERRAELEAEAKAVGKIGWLVGAGIEVTPHIRRPHLFMAHTGPGRTIPKIVPRRGSIVHRNKITEVPSGYLDNTPTIAT